MEYNGSLRIEEGQFLELRMHYGDRIVRVACIDGTFKVVGIIEDRHLGWVQLTPVGWMGDVEQSLSVLTTSQSPNESATRAESTDSATENQSSGAEND